MDDKTREAVALLISLAEVVLDSDDAKAYCRGLGTTPKKLEKAVEKAREAVKYAPQISD